MREIKFRAWDGEKMVSPDHIDRWGNAWWTENSIPTRSGTVMQYTGLKDKNGKEIYESDILRNKWIDVFGKDIGQKWQVKFGEYDNSDIEYGSSGNIGFFCESATRQQEGLNNLSGDGIEVIGNIYENPKLFKTT